MNSKDNFNKDINQIKIKNPQKNRYDIRRRFDDNIEIAKEFESPVQTGNIYLEENEKKLLDIYKKKENKK